MTEKAGSSDRLCSTTCVLAFSRTHRMRAGSHHHQRVLAHVPCLPHEIQFLWALWLREERLDGQKPLQLAEQVSEQLWRTSMKLLRDHKTSPVADMPYFDHATDVAEDY